MAAGRNRGHNAGRDRSAVAPVRTRRGFAMRCRRFLVPLCSRPVLLPAALAFLVGVAGFAGQRRAAADSFERDPVADFRQALLQEKDASRDKDALRFREENLTRKARALSLGDMSRVLLLQEWRGGSVGGAVSDLG